MFRLGKYIVIIMVFVLCGCASKQGLVKNSKITLPDRPDPVRMDQGKHDRDKFPNTKWVEKPKIDLKRGLACWKFKDVETISKSLAEWEFWYKDVEELIEGHNNLIVDEGQRQQRPWWRIW